MENLFKSIDFIRQYKAENPNANKAQLQSAWIAEFNPKSVSKVFVGQGFAVRFSQAKSAAFSSTVLALSKLKPHDTEPFIVVACRPQAVDFYLANSTLLKKVSHSSRDLRVDNVRGSFNGTDIITEYAGLPNTPQNFVELFAQHSAFTWEENLARLVEATNEIVARITRFAPSEHERTTILDAPRRASDALLSAAFVSIEDEFRQIVESRKGEIIQASSLDNVNLRGNAIEQLITGEGNAHELGDIIRPLGDSELVIDVKTKLLDRASAPKAYNVDKVLKYFSQPGSIFAFLMVGIDTQTKEVRVRLLPVLEQSLLDVTAVQHHWAGRGSRGVTQLSGPFGVSLIEEYHPIIDVPKAQKFLLDLINI